MRILAVDDDPIILELLAQFAITVGNHDLETALSGTEALEIANSAGSDPFDCFLFDIQMPEMDGIQLTQTIRRSPPYADTPILMLTAMSDKRHVDAAFSAGATDYVTKPFEVLELKARLGLVENLVQARQSRTKKVFATQGISATSQPYVPAGRLEIFEPISIYDVDNVIEIVALENYVAQLSRSTLFGSTAFAFTIRKVEEHYQTMSAFEFHGLVSDVAEVISDTLAGRQFLMSYAGSGTFVCVTESGWRPDMSALMDAVNLSLSRTELYGRGGQKLHVRVSAGEVIRLVWKSGNSLMEALAAAHVSAEAASTSHERGLKDLWMVEQRA